ncbi:MAG: cell wall hydrolase [Erythrobacter sp.]|nr:cell wall hydrolase [Erythrobacter sp.]
MQFVSKRVGAVALAAFVFATSYGLAASGATAQDQAEQGLEQVQSDDADNEIPTVRFVAQEVVQALPATAETAPEADAEPAVDADSLRGLVASIDTSGAMSRELTCLAEAVYFEARGEPLDGQLAVARVIVNRAESSQFPDDYCGVVTQRGQFSFVRGGHIPTPNLGSAAWDSARAIARIAHRDLWQSAAADSLFFHATRVRPAWAGRRIARATIENHVFYR